MSLTQYGYNVTGEEEYFNSIIESLKVTFPNINTDKANYAIVMARMFARNEARRDQEIADLYNAAYVSSATGYSLDKAVWVAGIKRLDGTVSVGKVVITKKSTSTSMLIPAYSELIIDSKIYITQNASAVDITSSTYEVDIKSKEVGTLYNLPISSTFKFVVPNVNVDTIISSTEITGGSNIETDVELRDRFFYTLGATKNSSLPSIIGQVKQVTGVTYISGKENNSYEEVDGMPPHSIEILISGGADADIAEAIAKTRAGGIKSFGTSTTEVIIDGITYSEQYTRLQTTMVYYVLNVVVKKDSVPQDIVDLIQAQVIDFTSQNNTIRKFDLDADVAQADLSIVGVMSSYFDVTENPTNSGNITADSGFKFVTENSKIIVNITEE